MTVCNLEPQVGAVTPGPTDGVPPLTAFYLYLTAGCNLHCRHCWITPSPPGVQRPGEFLQVDLLRQAVSEAKPLGLSSAKLTGGEPLLHPHFREIVDLLSAAGLALRIETNATLVDAALAQDLKARPAITHIAVSLDGPTAEVHDPFRGTPGSFDAAMQGLQHLVAVGYRPQIIMSLYCGNVQHVEALVELAVRLGAGSVKFNPVSRSGRGIAMHERGEALDAAQLLKLARFIRGDLQHLTPIPLFLSTPPALCTVGELFQASRVGICHIRNILGILSSGEMALCGIGRNVPDLVFGQVGRDSLPEVWANHPVLRRLRRELDDEYPGLCGQCIHARSCLTGCVAQNYQDDGRLVAPAWLCTEAYERGLFPTSRLRRAT